MNADEVRNAHVQNMLRIAGYDPAAKGLVPVEVADFVREKYVPLAKAHNKLVDRVTGLEARLAAVEESNRVLQRQEPQ